MNGATDPAGEAVRRPPNFVFILADQLRSDFLGCYGGEAVATPHIDRLAAEGMQFNRAVSASPLCVPARTALLTGMSAMRNGVVDNLRFLRPDYHDVGIRTWPELLADAGYATASAGKMHFYPWDASLGFQQRTIAEDKTWSLLHDDLDDALRTVGREKVASAALPTTGHPLATVNPNPRELTPDGFVGDAACDLIRTMDADRPFALMVGFPGPHDPYDPRRDSLAIVDPARLPGAVPAPDGIEKLQQHKRDMYQRLAGIGHVDYSDPDPEATAVIRTHYAALVGEIDDEVGRIRRELERRGLLDDTVVIVSADHGDHLGDHGLSVGKRTFFESAIRVPMIFCGPGIPVGTDDTLVELRDITATMLRLAGRRLPAIMDALPLFSEEADDAPRADSAAERRTAVVGMLSDGVMVHDGRWKLHKYRTGDIILHDLDADPDQMVNRYRDPDCQPVVERLEQTLTAELIDSFQASVTDRRAAATILEMVQDGEGFGNRGWQRPWPNDVDTG